MSVHNDLADALVTTITATAGVPDATKRRFPVLEPIDIPDLPKCFVSMGDERLVDQQMNNGNFRQYDLIITWFTASNFLDASGIDTIRGYRQTVRRKLGIDSTVSLPLLSVAGCWNVDFEEAEDLDDEELKRGYDVIGLLAAYTVSEVNYAA